MAPKKKGKKADEPPPSGLLPTVGLLHHSLHCADTSEAGSAVRHLRGGNRDACVGVMAFTEGVHHIVYTIDASSNGSGFGIILGVCDADANQPFPAGKLTDRAGGPAWGMIANSGQACKTVDCYQRGLVGASLLPDEAAGGLKRHAKGAVVEVVVDMERRTLAYSINGGELVVDTAASLPLCGVRPWMLLGWEGDTVTLEVDPPPPEE